MAFLPGKIFRQNPFSIGRQMFAALRINKTMMQYAGMTKAVFFLGLSVLLFATVQPTPCFGETALSNTHITLQCNNVTVSECVNHIQDMTHARIFIPEKSAAKKLTLSLSNVTLDQAFKQIATDISLENYSVMFNEEMKTIYLTVLGDKDNLFNSSMGAMSPESAIAPVSEPPAVADPNAAPEASGKVVSSTPADDDEVLPPSTPGGHGLTYKELREQEAKLPPLGDPLDMEALPPANPGEKGKTLRQLQADDAKARLNETGTTRIEALPPAVPGGKGMTLEELKAQEPKEPMQLPDSPFPPSSMIK